MLSQRGANSTLGIIPSPVGGWNARDALDNMDPRDALDLTNWFPGPNYCETRNGHITHATGLPGAVETVLAYAGQTTKKLLAASGGGIYDATAGGVVGAALGSGFASNRWQYVNFKGFALLFNGSDTPQKFDGATLAANIFTGTGLTPANLVNPCIYKQRLFVVEKNSAKFWYAPVSNIAGALSSLDLSGLTPNGGVLLAIGTWVRDGGSGPDDLCCFFFDSGDVVVYRGTDPGSATNWSLVGTFPIAPPLGYRCLQKWGADLMVVTEEGYSAVSRALPVARSSNEPQLSDKISGAVRAATRAQPAAFGWQAIHYPQGGMGIFNVPKGGGVYEQHVINMDTGAWCRFTGINAHCWAIHGNDPYFGGAGTVHKADTGLSDNGVDIVGTFKSAFNYFGRRELKAFKLARPNFASTADVPLAIRWDVDFAEGTDLDSKTDAPGITAWRTILGIGNCGALRLRTDTNAQKVKLYTTDVRFQVSRGGM